MKQLTFIIGGDLAPTLSNYSIFENGNIESIIDGKILNLLNSADFRIFNLEVPLTDIKNPIRKDGPNLIAPAATINGIKLIGPDVLTLANNHILDQDEQGLFQTMEQLDKAGIKYVGAGKNLEEAASPLILKKDGLTIGIYACAEHEFTIAGEKIAGANPFDPLESPDHIARLKARCDYVIVLHHGGKEHYRYPTPGLRKVCRKMADKGADLVVCQHSHCIGAFEKYNEATIVYGQGNFLFDRSDNEFWSTGLLLQVSLAEKLFVEYIPFCKKGNGVQLAEKKDEDSILGPFSLRSEQILKPGFVESEFARYCDENGQYYMAVFAGFGKIVRNIDKLFKGFFTRRLYSWKKASLIQNHVECESQRETVIGYLNNKRLRN